MNSTATGAGNEKTTNTTTFRNQEHEEFYIENLMRCRYQDACHKALIYCLGISCDTRRNIERIYDFKTGDIKPKCLQEGWQTSGSLRVVRLAFNLYCNGSNNYGGLCTDVSPNPDRGYANVDISFEQKEILDMEKVKKNLCTACFNTIIDISWSDNPYSIGIIDFDTLEVRLLEECVTSFLFGDFYITCNHETRQSEDETIKLNLFVFYYPERY